jgi:DNA-binding MarR family transcriptional regulator
MSEIRKLKRVVIKEELVALTGHYLAALTLNQFLYWSERTKDFDKFIREETNRSPETKVQLTHGWIYKTATELAGELMIEVGPATMRKYIDQLVQKGWLDQRNNPNLKWDRTLQYRPNIRKIQADLAAIGYVLDGYPLVIDEKAFPKNGNGTPENGNQSPENGNRTDENWQAIPETTPQTTPNITPEDLPPPRDFLDDVVAGIGKVSEATAPNPDDQWFCYRNRFEAAYKRINPYMDATEKEAVVLLAQEHDASPDRFETACRETKLNSTGIKVPVGRVIEVYRAGGTWADWQRWKNQQEQQAGGQRNGNGRTRTGRNGSHYKPDGSGMAGGAESSFDTEIARVERKYGLTPGTGSLAERVARVQQHRAVAAAA